MENRVYEVEIEVADRSALRSPSERFRIAKFYRPGRWSQAQILEEHEFLFDLLEHEIPVVAPLRFADGTTLNKVPDCDIWFALFAKAGGRCPDEFSDEQLERLGRLLGRMHNVGVSKKAEHRLRLDPTTYGLENLQYLLQEKRIPLEITTDYQTVVEQICKITQPWFQQTAMQRIHGDCHIGNILWTGDGPFLVDFDDMVVGPCVQDLWLVLPGRPSTDPFAKQQLETLLSAYEVMRPFDRTSLKLIEPLRALRFIHFSAWIARRWQDPAFPRAFPQFAERDYWHKQLFDLKEQLQLIQQGV
jgi:Ser/Thr protein kinase RdoA (MazF antagonist)